MSSAIEEFRANLTPARFDEYFGAWAMESNRLMMMRERLTSMDVRRHLQEHESELKAYDDGYRRPNSQDSCQTTSTGTLIVSLTGTLMKQCSSYGGTSTVSVRRLLRLAARDESVKNCLLLIDSPGGTVAGTHDLAMDVREFGKIKPIDAYIEDLGASAAYWVASQCRKVYSNEGALIGSIGTLGVYLDSSKYYENEGFKVRVISTGQFKGTGVQGTEITDEQLAYLQKLVDGNQSIFNADVAAGRGAALKRVESWADGRVFRASEALTMGLIDGIQTRDLTIANLAKAKPARSAVSASLASDAATMFDAALPTETADAAPEDEEEDPCEQDPEEIDEEVEKPKSETTSGRPDETLTEDALMTTQNAAGAPAPAPVAAASAAIPAAVAAAPAADLGPKAATLAELKAGCFGADANFLVAQIEAGATLASAQTAWMAHMANENATLKTKLEANKPAERPGVDALGAGVGTSSEESGGLNAVDKWNAEFDSRLKAGMSREQAKADIDKKHPTLRAAYVDAFNAENKAKLAVGPRNSR